MARIAGVDIPRNKKIEVSIRYIYGIGASNGSDILQRANVRRSTESVRLWSGSIGSRATSGVRSS
jgi:small subunit ribosomal protein S13